MPSGELDGRNKYESDRIPENGGLSPRFTARLRGVGSGNTSHHREGGSSAAADNFEKQFVKVLHKVHQTIEKNEIRLAEQERRDVIKTEWQQVALVVDRILLVIFICLTLSVTLGIMLNAPYSRNYLMGTVDKGS